MDNYKVYLHNNIINNKKYIGLTSKDLYKRWKNGEGYKGQFFYTAIKKYGWNNFEHEVVYENLSKEEACDKEIELIKKYNTIAPNGYNISNGGDTNYKSNNIICINTLEVFKNPIEVITKQIKILKNKYNPNDIKDCCNISRPFIITPYKKEKFYYQYLTKHIRNIKEIEDLYNINIKKQYEKSRCTLVSYRDKKEFELINGYENSGYYIRNGYKICNKCGKLFKEKGKFCLECKKKTNFV